MRKILFYKDFLAEQHNAFSEFSLVLGSPPAIAGVYTFTVKYYQKGTGLEYSEYTTSPVGILVG